MAPRLTLYHFEGCTYCDRVRRAVKDLELDVEMRDIERDPQARQQLVQATGRTTVPVLREREEREKDRWMPESGDIVRHLYERFGDGRKPPLSARFPPQLVLVAVLMLGVALLIFR